MSTTYQPDDLLKTADAEKVIGMSAGFLANKRCNRAENQPRYHRVGGRAVRYKYRDLMAWLESQAVGSVAE